MIIAHIVDCMEVGGAETLVSQMCRLQREQGHDPRVYAIWALGALGEQLQRDGFVVQPHIGGSLANAPRALFQIFRSTRPSVVHLHNPTPTVYAAIAARMAGVPSIISTRHSLVARPRRLVVELKYAVAATCCDWIVGICDATANNLREIHTIPRRKIRRIYNGANSLLPVARELCPDKSGITLVFVGRLEPVKNHALLLRAFAKALSILPELRLWMVGDGSERGRLESLSAELGLNSQVKFWGQQLDVAPFYSAADAFIMSSRSEGLPISLLQAFSLGLPSIVTDVGGMAEVVRLARAGIITPAGDVDAMAAAIVRLATHPEERQQFSMNAEASFRSHFTLQTMTDAYLELYRTTPRAARANR
jgi:glycosyltransferase involved in cell wall biosynthesis